MTVRKKQSAKLTGDGSTISPLFLGAVYLILCAIRFGLACLTNMYPTTIPDEELYYSIARSLGTGNGALVYGQKANYAYLLYSLVLSPIYAIFGNGTRFFRLIQLENTLLMNLSLLPIFLLSREMIQDERKAFGLSVLSLLFPDFILSAGVFSESILYPIFFLMMYICWKGLKTGRVSDFVKVGVLGAFLFAIKPGQIVTPIVGMIMMASLAMKTDRKKGIAGLLCGLVSLAVVSALLMTVSSRLINPGTSVISAYEGQVGFEEESSFGAFIKALVLSPFAFMLAGGVVLLIVPLLRFREFGNEKRLFLNVILVSAGIIMLGTAWVVNRVEFINPPIHTRYVAMFLPVLLLVMNSDRDDSAIASGSNDFRMYMILLGFLIYAVLCVVIFGGNGIFSTAERTISQYALNALRHAMILNPGSVLAAVILLAVIAGVMVFLAKGGKHWLSVATLLTAVLIAVNNVSVYRDLYTNIYWKRIDTTDQIMEALGDEDYLYVYANRVRLFNKYLDINTRKNISMVSVFDLYNRLAETEGVYEPFIPSKLRVTIPDRNTTDTDLILMDMEARARMKFAPATQIVMENDFMTLVRIPRGERWLDSMFAGITDDRLQAGTSAVFTSFEEKGTHEKLKIDMEFSQDTKVRIYSDKAGSFEFTFPAGRDHYSIDFPPDDDKIFVKPMDSDIIIHGYEFI